MILCMLLSHLHFYDIDDNVDLNLDISISLYNKGCFLDDHIDGKSPVKNYASMLVYLNKDWNEEWGGDLELWDKNKENCITKISPIANRCVIFNTTGFAWHGHPLPLNCPSNITKSLALYYYNVDNSIIDAHSTIF